MAMVQSPAVSVAHSHSHSQSHLSLPRKRVVGFTVACLRSHSGLCVAHAPFCSSEGAPHIRSRIKSCSQHSSSSAGLFVFAANTYSTHALHGKKCTRKSVTRTHAQSPSSSSEKTDEQKKQGGTSSSSPPAHELKDTRTLVEAALFASMTALVFHISTLLRMESTFGAMYPLPTVLASVRHGARGCLLTVCIATVLLVTLAGPVRTASFVLMHGTVGVAAGLSYASGLAWTPAIFVTAIARTLGAIGTVVLSSAIMGENLFVIVASQAYALVDAALGAFNAQASPSLSSIAVGTLCLIFTNCVVYTFLLFVLYGLVVRTVLAGGVTSNVGRTLRLPRRIQRIFPDTNHVPSTLA